MPIIKLPLSVSDANGQLIAIAPSCEYLRPGQSMISLGLVVTGHGPQVKACLASAQITDGLVDGGGPCPR
jgi:hypothetical protein